MVTYISLVEAAGLNSGPVAALIPVLFFVGLFFALANGIEGLLYGFKTKSFRQGRTFASILLWVLIGLIIVVVPFLPAPR